MTHSPEYARPDWERETQFAERAGRYATRPSGFALAGLAVLGLVALGAYLLGPDLVRYMRIRNM
jgi:hypothetical protein